jgi:hypothetical protein
MTEMTASIPNPAPDIQFEVAVMHDQGIMHGGVYLAPHWDEATKRVSVLVSEGRFRLLAHSPATMSATAMTLDTRSEKRVASPIEMTLRLQKARGIVRTDDGTPLPRFVAIQAVQPSWFGERQTGSACKPFQAAADRCEFEVQLEPGVGYRIDAHPQPEWCVMRIMRGGREIPFGEELEVAGASQEFEVVFSKKGGRIRAVSDGLPEFTKQYFILGRRGEVLDLIAIGYGKRFTTGLLAPGRYLVIGVGRSSWEVQSYAPNSIPVREPDFLKRNAEYVHEVEVVNGQTVELQVSGAPDPRWTIISSLIRRSADLGLNPSNDGKLIRVPIPPLNEERRRELAREILHIARIIACRCATSAGMGTTAWRKLLTDKLISEDDEVQKLTDGHIKKVDELAKAKEKELMELK